MGETEVRSSRESVCGSMKADDRFSCAVYEQRPTSCRDYPWRSSQVLFEDCIFVEQSVVRPANEVIAEIGLGAIEEACRTCGKCCYGWVATGARLVPMIRCS